jgi:hypothetical protein
MRNKLNRLTQIPHVHPDITHIEQTNSFGTIATALFASGR